MANRVQYGPSAVLGGQVAYQSGLGQHLKEQQRFAEQQNQQAFDQALRQQAMDLQQSQFANNQQVANRNFAYQIARDRNAALQQQQRLDMELAARMAENQASRAFEWDKMEFAENAWQDRTAVQEQYQAQHNQALWDKQSVDTAEQGLADMISQYRKMPLTEEGRQILHQAEGQLRTLQARRANYRDGQYSQLLGEIAENLQKQRIEDFQEPPPQTIADLEQQGRMIEKYDRDGNFLGWMTFDFRNGVEVPKFLPAPKQQQKNDLPDPTKAPVETAFGQMGSKDVLGSFLEIDNDIEKRLIARAKAASNDGSLAPGWSVDPDEYDKELQAALNRYRRYFLGQNQKPEEQAPLVNPNNGGEQVANGVPVPNEGSPSLPPPPNASEIPQLSTPFDVQAFTANPNDVGYFAGPDGRIFFKTPDGKVLRDESWGTVGQ